MEETALTFVRFIEIHPQFAGVSNTGAQIINEQLSYANLYVCCSVWGDYCERGRALLTAHYASQFLELLEEAEDSPETAGGTIVSAGRISSEKVGEVEVKFHKPSSLATNITGEKNDPLTEDLKETIYGKQFLALQRRIGLFVATTSACFR